MNSTQTNSTTLPVAGDLTTTYACTLTISILMTVAAAGGIIYRQTVYPAEGLRAMFVSNDIVNLCAGLPFLLGPLLLIRKGEMTGLLALLGALLFVLYNYLVYILAIPPGIPFLLHVTLVILSAGALVSLMRHIDAAAVRQRLAGAVSERITGGILAGLGVLFFARTLSVLLPGIIGQNPIPRTELAVSAADLLITPLWIAGGVLFAVRKAVGYVAAIGLLSQAGMLFVALLAYLVLQPFLTATPIHWRDVAVIAAMSSVCFVPLILLLRGAQSCHRS